MSAVEKRKFLHRRGEVLEARKRWIIIECEVFGFTNKYMIGIRDYKTMTVVVERVRARGDITKVQGLR